MNTHLNQLRLMRTTAVGANADALDTAIKSIEEIVKNLRKRGDEYDKPWFLGESHALREAATVIETTYLRPPVRPKT